MTKTFEVVEAYAGNYAIKAYEDSDCVLDIIVNDYNVEGARCVGLISSLMTTQLIVLSRCSQRLLKRKEKLIHEN